MRPQGSDEAVVSDAEIHIINAAYEGGVDVWRWNTGMGGCYPCDLLGWLAWQGLRIPRSTATAGLASMTSITPRWTRRAPLISSLGWPEMAGRCSWRSPPPPSPSPLLARASPSTGPPPP